MTEQENCGQALLDLEETRMVTVGELMDMIDKLNAAFAEKLGKEPASGFNAEIKGISPDRVVIWGGYESFGVGSPGAVVSSPDCYGSTPNESFDYVMSAINNYHVPTKGDKIKALKAQIADLEGATVDD